MTLGKKPKRYHLRTGDRFAVTPKSGRGRFTIWPALLFVIVASVYYIHTKNAEQDAELIAQQDAIQEKSDGIITGAVPTKK